MNLYIVSRGYPSSKDPQWGNFETDQARALAALNHHVVMLSVDIRYSGAKNKLGITTKSEQGVRSYSLNPGPLVVLRYLNYKLYRLVAHKLLLYLYSKVVNIEGWPDIIYAHYQDNIESSLYVKEKFNVPVVGLEHWSALGFDNPPKEAVENGIKIYQSLDKLLVVSKSLQNNIKKYCDVDSEVLSNIIGDEFCYKECNNCDGVVRFVLTGNLKPVKCIDMAIEAFAKVYNNNKQVRFTIVGDGVEKDNLLKLIEKKDLSGVIQLAGRKDRNYIVQLLQSSDVYVLSSSSETFGVAAGEALACGVPVIATDCGGPRDFMNDFNGLLIPVNDVEALSEAMGYMANHYKEFDRKRIAQDCYEKFSSEAIASQLTTIFKEVIKR